MEDGTKIKDIEKILEKLQNEISALKQMRVSQTSVIPGAIKMRAMGEGNRFMRSGLEANLPTSGETATDSSAYYYATDTNKLYIWDGTQWNSKLVTDTNEDWITPTFQNSWVNYGSVYNPAGYYKDNNGIVHLRGLVKSGTISTTLPIFTLPAGYIPEYKHIFAVETNPNANGRCDVTTSGEVIPNTGDNGWFSLDNVSFRAYQ